MKKKHRDITVNGIRCGWIGGCGQLSIYKDKKVVFYTSKITESSITPSIVEKIIKENNL